MITFQLIEEIRRKADIATVIGHYLKLVKAGNNYKAVCPFHDDTRPSLSISTEKQIYKCFACNHGGNCFTFIMDYEHVDFITAVKKVCEICHIDLPELKDLRPAPPKENADLYEAIKELAGFYHFALRQADGHDALEYLKVRQMTDEVIDHFKIGYAPSDNSRSIKLLRERYNFSIETLNRAGILAQSSANFLDRYRDRIMFPLDNLKGETVGFSGRIYRDEDHDESKYINSPETPIFRKSDILYNFKNASETCRRDGYLYLLEGFMDVIALYKAGITSAVALMGTALTEDHVKIFHKLKVEIRLCLDNDEAGQNATYRSSQLLTKSGIKYKIIKTMHGGKDPDEILNTVGREGLLTALNALEEPLVFEMDYLSKHGQLVTLEQKEAFIDSKMTVLSSYGQLVRSEVIQRIASTLHLSEENIDNKIARARSSPSKVNPVRVSEHVNSFEINPKLFNHRAVYHCFLASDKVPDSKDDKKFDAYKSICSLESGIIVRMAQFRAAYDYFFAHDGFFLTDIYNIWSACLGSYYSDHDVDHLEYGDYQAMIDSLYFLALTEDDKNLLVRFLECMKICESKPYSHPDFRNTLERKKHLLKSYNAKFYKLYQNSSAVLIEQDEMNKSKKVNARKNGEN